MQRVSMWATNASRNIWMKATKRQRQSTGSLPGWRLCSGIANLKQRINQRFHGSTYGWWPCLESQISCILDTYITIHNSRKLQCCSSNGIVFWLGVTTTWGTALRVTALGGLRTTVADDFLIEEASPCPSLRVCLCSHRKIVVKVEWWFGVSMERKDAKHTLKSQQLKCLLQSYTNTVSFDI